MPYIEQKDRRPLRRKVKNLTALVTEPGELAYVLYLLSVGFLKKSPVRFFRIALVMGVLICTLLEVWYRHVLIYETLKRAKNGDVKP